MLPREMRRSLRREEIGARGGDSRALPGEFRAVALHLIQLPRIRGRAWRYRDRRHCTTRSRMELRHIVLKRCHCAAIVERDVDAQFVQLEANLRFAAFLPGMTRRRREFPATRLTRSAAVVGR